jgi:Transcriptional regulators
MENNMALIQLTRLMADMVRHLSRDAGKKLSGEITWGQFLCLRKIESGINKVSNLAEKMRITPAAASKMADSLVEAGLLDRVRSEDDKRIYTLMLTPHGKKLLCQNIIILKDIMDESFGILSQEDINDLTRIFTKVLSQYDLMNSDNPGRGND